MRRVVEKELLGSPRCPSRSGGSRRTCCHADRSDTYCGGRSFEASFGTLQQKRIGGGPTDEQVKLPKYDRAVIDFLECGTEASAEERSGPGRIFRDDVLCNVGYCIARIVVQHTAHNIVLSTRIWNADVLVGDRFGMYAGKATSRTLLGI